MKSAGSTWIRITVTGILFLLLLSGTAFAEKEYTLTAACPSRCTEKVIARNGKDGLILSLPGFWDLSRITLEMANEESLLLGNEKKEVRAGEETDLSGMTGRKIPLRNGNEKDRGTLTVLQGSEIPSLFLEVDAEALKRVNRSKENMITEGRAVYMEADGTVAYDGALDQLKGRGNNTFRYSKKPYQLKLREKASFSGMGKGKTWVLLANWLDVSLLRNQIVLDMSREIGLRNAVSCVQADIWINGSYNGLYLLTEKIQIGRNRIDITNLEKATETVNDSPFCPGKTNTEKSDTHPLLRSYPQLRDPEDITGGYLLTIEKRSRLKNNVLAGFLTKKGLSIRIKEPTYPSRAQAAYVFDRITEMQDALTAEDGINPETGKTFEEYLDVSSFARKFLIEDWCKDFDFPGGSQFLYKDSDRVDPLFYAGPSWDYDLCFGNMALRGYPAGGRYVTAYRRDHNIYWLLYNHESFREAAGRIWRNSFRNAAGILLSEKPASPESIVRPIEEYSARIRASAAMNYRRWPVSSEASGQGSGGSFDNAVKYLKRWVAERTAWMDGEYMPETAGNKD